MTTTVQQPAAPGTRSAAGGPRAAVGTLALFEARRLLTRVPVLVAFAVYAGWTVWRAGRAWGDFPVLQDADRATQSAPILVGLAVMLSVNQAALRSRRHGTEQVLTVLVLPPWRRTAAHALSVLAPVLVTAVCVAAQFGREALRPGAVGRGSVAELLVGPLTVLLLGLFGLLAASLVRSALVAPLLIVFCLFLFLGSTGVGDGWEQWLVPAVGAATGNSLPVELIGRPAAWHALYLAGLGLSLGLLAVLVAGGRRPAVLAGTAAALALTVLGAVAQSGGDSRALTEARERATLHPERVHSCVRRDGSTYCAFPDWEPWTGEWARVVDRVRSLAGGAAHERDVVVRQRIDARYGLTGDGALPALTRPYEVTVSTQWGGNRVPEFAAAVAGVLIAGDEEAATSICDGRVVPLMWLAVGWESDPLSALRRVRLGDTVTGSDTVLQPTNVLFMTEAQTEVLRGLLDLPRAEATARVKEHWAALTTPKVTAAGAAKLLGLPAPEGEDTCR
ncbi:ABC transporter permease [Streptomyces sp. NPDC093516]|uniref:ABC transporter permease n=1 Tax=Streptomyces sp. NPDC093516 TaxID=3155304 RepID=UPI0034499CB7